jgi:hypothetical protein
MGDTNDQQKIEEINNKIGALNSEIANITAVIDKKTEALNAKEAELAKANSAGAPSSPSGASSPGGAGGGASPSGASSPSGPGGGSIDISVLTQEIKDLTQEIQVLNKEKDKIDAEIKTQELLKTSTIPPNPVSIIVPVESTGTGSNGTATATPNNTYSVEYDTKNKVANVTTPDGKNYLVGVALTLGKEPSISIVKPDATAAATQEIKKQVDELTMESIEAGMDAYKKKLEVKLKTELGLADDEDVPEYLTNIQQPNDKLLGDTYELIMRCGLLIKFLNTKLTAPFLGKRSERKVPNANIKRALDALLDVYGIAATKEWLTVKNTSGLKKGDDKDKALPIEATNDVNDVPKDNIYFTYLRELNDLLKLNLETAVKAKKEAESAYNETNKLKTEITTKEKEENVANITLSTKERELRAANDEARNPLKPNAANIGSTATTGSTAKTPDDKARDAANVVIATTARDTAKQKATTAQQATIAAKTALQEAKDKDTSYISTLQQSYNAFIIEDTYLNRFNQSQTQNSNRFDGFITPFAQIIIESTLVFKSYTEANLKGAWLFNSANPVPRWTRSKIFTDTITTFQAHNDFLIYLNLYKHLLELKNRYEGKEDANADPNAGNNSTNPDQNTTATIGGRSTRKEHRRYLKKENRRTNKRHRRSFRRK